MTAGSAALRPLGTTESDSYLLGRSEAEEARLRQQIVDLAPNSEAHLDKIDIKPGERVADIGCGPGGVLHLLGNRVGPSGTVVGIDCSPHFIDLARHFVADLGMSHVEIRDGDAYNTGLPRASFDGAHMRLLLVNVPNPELIVREVVSLVRPGGWVASFEADYVSHTLDPPLPEYSRLLEAYRSYAADHGIDLFVGRRLHRLFREAGVTDIHVDAVVHVYPVGHSRRPIFRDFINNVREKLVAGGYMSRHDLERDLAVVERSLADPDVLTTSHVFYRLWGRVPTQQ